MGYGQEEGIAEWRASRRSRAWSRRSKAHGKSPRASRV
jgi:hypothetical protein